MVKGGIAISQSFLSFALLLWIRGTYKISCLIPPPPKGLGKTRNDE